MATTDLYPTICKRLASVARTLKRLPKADAEKLILRNIPFHYEEERELAILAGAFRSIGDLLEEEREYFARDTERQILSAVDFLVAPEYRSFACSHRDLAARVLLPFDRPEEIYGEMLLPDHPYTPINFVFPLLAVLAIEGKGTGLGTHWPEDVTQAEVKQWAAHALRRDTPGATRKIPTDPSGLVLYPTSPCCLWEAPQGPVLVSSSLLAFLYRAERAARELAPSPLLLAPVSTEKPVRRAVSSLNGVHPLDMEKSSELLRKNDPLKLEFRWDDGTTLELPFEKAGPTAPLLAVAHKYGNVAVKHLLALFAFTWGARARAGQSFWWWPAEHLEVVGLKNNQENRDNLKRWIEGMTKSRFIVHYPKGKPARGPLVTVGMDIVAPFEDPEFALFLHLHPALYQGITDRKGRPGNQWWPTPLELLRLPADRSAGKVHVLAPVMGAMFRAGLHEGRGDAAPVARVSAERLADYLAIQKREDRDADPRAAGTLRRTLEAARESGFLASWHLEGGELERLTGNIIATPGPLAMEIINTGGVPRPAWLPTTSSDLKNWIELQGKTTAEIGKMLGIPASTLRWAASFPSILPLPPNVRAALRRYLWRIPTP